MADCEQLLRELLDQIASEQGYDDHSLEVHPVNSNGANYTTRLYAVAVNTPGKPSLQLFGKVQVFSEEFRTAAKLRLYDIENYFYTKVAKLFNELQDKHNITGDDRLRLPKLYGINTEYLQETVVLEDLRAAGYREPDRFRPTSWEYAASVIDELAKFHALSLAYAHEHPDAFRRLHADLPFPVPDDKEAVKHMVEKFTAYALAVVKEEYKERFLRHLGKYGTAESMLDYHQPIRRPVIAHGEIKLPNMLHRDRNDGTYDIIFLDYQTVHMGCAVSDLMYFIFTGTDREFRRQHQGALVSRYRGQLAAALRRLRAPDTLYTDQDFHYEMEKVLPYGLPIAMAALLIQLVQVDDAPDPSGGDDFSSAFAMKPNQLYGDRLNGIIEDFIEWGLM